MKIILPRYKASTSGLYGRELRKNMIATKNLCNFLFLERFKLLNISWMQHRVQFEWGLYLTCAFGFWHYLLDQVKKDLEQDPCQVKTELLFFWRLNPLATCAQSIFLLVLVKQVLAAPQDPEPVLEWIYQQGVVTGL